MSTKLSKEIFKARLEGRPIECGKLSVFRGRRTDFVLALWENDIIEFHSAYRCQSAMFFTVNYPIRIRPPIPALWKWADLADATVFQPGVRVDFNRLDANRLFEFYKAKLNRNGN